MMSKPTIKNCEYCLLATGKEPCIIVLENEYVAAFLEPNSASSGSVIVTTKQHYFDIDELDEPTAAAVMNALQTVTRAIKTVFEPDGIGLLQNSGKFSDTLHFHIHVFPRYRNDWFRGLAGDFPGPVAADAAETAAELRAALTAQQR
ncbi:MAG: HIT family protein [Bacillota bacterium]